MSADDERDPEPTEGDMIVNYRLEQALLAGVPVDLADKFALGAGDLHRLYTIIGQGCDPSVAARILT